MSQRLPTAFLSTAAVAFFAFFFLLWVFFFLVLAQAFVGLGREFFFSLPCHNARRKQEKRENSRRANGENMPSKKVSLSDRKNERVKKESKVNPFERRVIKRKFDVLGQPKKKTEQSVGEARSKAFETVGLFPLSFFFFLDVLFCFSPLTLKIHFRSAKKHLAGRV
jgi:hypothetical protein